eukprot:3030903-Amphidinium_carterae.1
MQTAGRKRPTLAESPQAYVVWRHDLTTEVIPLIINGVSQSHCVPHRQRMVQMSFTPNVFPIGAKTRDGTSHDSRRHHAHSVELLTASSRNNSIDAEPWPRSIQLRRNRSSRCVVVQDGDRLCPRSTSLWQKGSHPANYCQRNMDMGDHYCKCFYSREE